jgi:ribose 1,5-bisphosphate isomerase
MKIPGHINPNKTFFILKSLIYSMLKKEANKQKTFNKICKEIQEIKIQGASNVAKAALRAYALILTKASKKKLLSLRPTEPMMHHALDLAEKGISKKQILEHFKLAQKSINKHVFNLIKNNSVIFTHCHSTNVTHSLIYARKQGKKFEIYNTETRPLYQGRKTAKELSKNHIKVTLFVDSAVGVALSREMNTKKVDMVLLGADAITSKGAINKIGSETIAILAKQNKIPVYIVADSWKISKHSVPIEQRKINEVWDKAPHSVKIKNPSFEFIPKKLITGIITEKGLSKWIK